MSVYPRFWLVLLAHNAKHFHYEYKTLSANLRCRLWVHCASYCPLHFQASRCTPHIYIVPTIAFELETFSKIHELTSLKECSICRWLQAETNNAAARAVTDTDRPTDQQTDTQSHAHRGLINMESLPRQRKFTVRSTSYIHYDS